MTHYIGRFAPSPTGRLHFGSLVSAIASFLDARACQGTWLLRIEDIDPPRIETGAADSILATLDAYALHWDGTPTYQSQRLEHYHHHLQQLHDARRTYYCNCSRRTIREQGGHLDNHCRQANNTTGIIRLHTQGSINWHDGIQGPQQRCFDTQGDFILKRRDGFFAYQLAVSVDDALQGITHIVRGSDLLSSTAMQIYLLQQWGYTIPHYAHSPTIINREGNKLSKQHFSPTLSIEPNAIRKNWIKALHHLGHSPPQSLTHQTINAIKDWAITHWSLSAIPDTLQQAEHRKTPNSAAP